MQLYGGCYGCMGRWPRKLHISQGNTVVFSSLKNMLNYHLSSLATTYHIHKYQLQVLKKHTKTHENVYYDTCLSKHINIFCARHDTISITHETKIPFQGEEDTLHLQIETNKEI